MNDPNKLHHIFGNPDHNLDVLVGHYGSEAMAGRAIIEAVDQAYRAGALTLDAQNRYRQRFIVGGFFVTVGGRIVNGIVRIGSAWVGRSRAGNRDA